MFDFIKQNFVLILLLTGLIMVLGGRRERENVKIRNMWFTIFCVVILMLADYGEYIAKQDQALLFWRIFFSVIGYWFRPMAALFLVQVLDYSIIMKRILWIPEFINIIVFSTAFFSPIAFSYDAEYGFTRGPLGYVVFVVAFFYIIVAVISTFRTYKDRSSVESRILLVCAFACAGASIVEALSTERILNMTIVISCIFNYIFLNSQEIRIEEAKQKVALKNALDSAEQANKSKSQFFFNVSHDIRTPMNAIIGFTLLLEKHLDNKELMNSYVEKIKESSSYLLEIINSVLDMGRIESGKVTLDETVVNYHDIDSSVSSVFESLISQKNLTFNRKFAMKHEYLYCDQTKLREIYLNIISNSVKYTTDGGTISLIVDEMPSDKEGYVYVRSIIEDNGIGMSKEYLNHIYEEFSRERTTLVNKSSGTGLGMAITKHFVEIMGGTIEIESELGKGTKTTITIPHRIAEKPMDKAQFDSEFENGLNPFVGKRLLLAEDNDLNAEIAEEILKDAGFEIHRVCDGIECVAEIEKKDENYYDAILMDIQMPNMDGYKATQVIRRMTNDKKNIPIFAMTANAFEEDKKNAIKAGMNGHIAKPIDVPSLMDALLTIIN